MLALDIGNSRLKWALFEGRKIVKKNAVVYTTDSIDKLLEEELLPFAGNDVWISNVAGKDIGASVSNFFASTDVGKVTFAATQAHQCGVENVYEITANLGVDRWLAMIAAFNHETREQGEAVCVVDCGTALTIDVIGAGGQHVGGLIMPGLRTMQSSLLDKSGVSQGVGLKSGNVLACGSKNATLLGDSTAECVELGCSQLMVEGVSGIIRRQREQLRDLRCFVTGGDAAGVLDYVGENTQYEPDLVLQGLLLAGSDR